MSGLYCCLFINKSFITEYYTYYYLLIWRGLFIQWEDCLYRGMLRLLKMLLLLIWMYAWCMLPSDIYAWCMLYIVTSWIYHTIRCTWGMMYVNMLRSSYGMLYMSKGFCYYCCWLLRVYAIARGMLYMPIFTRRLGMMHAKGCKWMFKDGCCWLML